MKFASLSKSQKSDTGSRIPAQEQIYVILQYQKLWKLKILKKINSESVSSSSMIKRWNLRKLNLQKQWKIISEKSRHEKNQNVAEANIIFEMFKK